ncbi:MAG: aminotransferase class IV, partial [Candidatus Sumerlaeia bacterium]|nr:aminotransferase class IV [Candidatus Sumerlaeia bacterium]
MGNELLWINGKIMELAGAQIALEDRGAQFSDGVYEVVVYYNQKPFMIQEHLERFDFSARGLMMEPPFTMEERMKAIEQLVEQSGFEHAMVYGQLTRGAARRNHLFPEGEALKPLEYWFVRKAPTYPAAMKENGVKLMSHPDERWAHCEYKTISLLPNVLAKERAKRYGAWESLLYREDGAVTECAASNAYCVINGAVHTHPLTPRILGGITRMAIKQCAYQQGIPFIEEAVTLEQFRKADEAFISSTTMEVMPATLLDNQPIGSGKVGRVTKQ